MSIEEQNGGQKGGQKGEQKVEQKVEQNGGQGAEQKAKQRAVSLNASDAATKPEPLKIEVMITDDGEFMLSIPLTKIGRTLARGVLEDARDAIDGWYLQRARQREALSQRNLSRNDRGVLARIGKLILPK